MAAQASKSLVSLPSVYTKILSSFPENLSFCFAYGSGVLRQSGNCSSDKNMIDLVFVVKNSHQWHIDNFKRNLSHYSFLHHLGPRFISRFQENWGAMVYYNTLIPIEELNVLIKYGVISESALITDLLDWNVLYVAGRLHKPVEILRPSSNSHLRGALQQNLHSAVHAALLLLPETFTETDFYRAIAGLSYSGDFRMIFGENKNKVVNIVAPQVKAFRKLYAPIVKSLKDFMHIPALSGEGACCSQDCSAYGRVYHLNQLPKTPQRAIVDYYNRGNRSQRHDTEDTLWAVAHDPECGDILKRCLQTIVWNSSVSQSLKGIFTAGLSKSMLYSLQKIVKMFKSS